MARIIQNGNGVSRTRKMRVPPTIVAIKILQDKDVGGPFSTTFLSRAQEKLNWGTHFLYGVDTQSSASFRSASSTLDGPEHNGKNGDGGVQGPLQWEGIWRKRPIPPATSYLLS